LLRRLLPDLEISGGPRAVGFLPRAQPNGAARSRAWGERRLPRSQPSPTAPRLPAAATRSRCTQRGTHLSCSPDINNLARGNAFSTPAPALDRTTGTLCPLAGATGNPFESLSSPPQTCWKQPYMAKKMEKTAASSSRAAAAGRHPPDLFGAGRGGKGQSATGGAWLLQATLGSSSPSPRPGGGKKKGFISTRLLLAAGFRWWEPGPFPARPVSAVPNSFSVTQAAAPALRESPQGPVSSEAQPCCFRSAVLGTQLSSPLARHAAGGQGSGRPPRPPSAVVLLSILRAPRSPREISRGGVNAIK